MRRKLLPVLLAILTVLCFSACSREEAPQIRDTAPTAELIPGETAPFTEPVTETTLPAETFMPQPEPLDGEFVRVADYIPDIRVELKYATSDNFTGRQIYSFTDVYLRYGTVRKLMAVQAQLQEEGLFLVIWDGFRPVSAQFTLWEICPDPTYVANPNTGFSAHSRGNTVDVTVADAQGRLLEMPTGFDDFSPLADRDYSDCSDTAAGNARMLQQIMEANGFTGYFGEWWHFSDTVRYDVEEVFTPVTSYTCIADCNEYISLRMHADVEAEVMLRIPAGVTVTVRAEYGDFAMVEYRGLIGYVLRSYLLRL